MSSRSRLEVDGAARSGRGCDASSSSPAVEPDSEPERSNAWNTRSVAAACSSGDTGRR
eukprot:ctg_6001.g556